MLDRAPVCGPAAQTWALQSALELPVALPRVPTKPRCGGRPAAGQLLVPRRVCTGGSRIAADLAEIAPIASSRAPIGAATSRPIGPDRIENRQEWQQNRVQRRDEIRNQVGRTPPGSTSVGLSRLGCLADQPSLSLGHVGRDHRLGRLRLESTCYYSYGDNVYYQGDSGLLRDQGRRIGRGVHAAG